MHRFRSARLQNRDNSGVTKSSDAVFEDYEARIEELSDSISFEVVHYDSIAAALVPKN
jgi:hypothetical protein